MGSPGKPYRGMFKAMEKSTVSYYPYATIAWDYINRAMPVPKPGSLTQDEVYALVAFLLYRNGIIQESDVMDAKSLPKVEMPNRNGFVPAVPVYPRIRRNPIGSERERPWGSRLRDDRPFIGHEIDFVADDDLYLDRRTSSSRFCAMRAVTKDVLPVWGPLKISCKPEKLSFRALSTLPISHPLGAGGRREARCLCQIAVRASRKFREAFSLPG